MEFCGPFGNLSLRKSCKRIFLHGIGSECLFLSLGNKSLQTGDVKWAKTAKGERLFTSMTWETPQWSDSYSYGPPARKEATRNGHLCCFWDQGASEEFFTGSLSKRGRTSKPKNNYKKQWKTDTGMHQKRQAFIKIAYGQLKKLNEKLRKRTCRKGTNAINTFLRLSPYPPPPQKCQLRTNAEGGPQVFSQLLGLNPGFLRRAAGTGIPLVPNLSRCYSFSPGPKKPSS